MTDSVVSTSKFLSLILRHKPETIDLTLDENGWANVNELIDQANHHGTRLDRKLIEQVVAKNDKKRFAFSDDGTRIRANQGHSLDVDLALTPQVPPETLFHGTATRFLDSIRTQGLIPGSRQHVHLSLLRETAISVGKRHGKVAVIVVKSGEMHRAGHAFFLSANGVWLTGRIAVEFLDFGEIQ